MSNCQFCGLDVGSKIPLGSRCPDCGRLFVPAADEATSTPPQERRPLELPPEGSTWTEELGEDSDVGRDTAEWPADEPTPSKETSDWDEANETSPPTSDTTTWESTGEDEVSDTSTWEAEPTDEDDPNKTVSEVDTGTVEWESSNTESGQQDTAEWSQGDVEDPSKKTLSDGASDTVDWDAGDAAAGCDDDGTVDLEATAQGKKTVQDGGESTVEWEDRASGNQGTAEWKATTDGSGATGAQDVSDPRKTVSGVGEGTVEWEGGSTDKLTTGAGDATFNEDVGNKTRPNSDATVSGGDDKDSRATDVGQTAGPSSKTANVKRDMTAIWGDSVEGARPETTIRAEATPIGTATRLAVRPRSMRDVNEPVESPADYELLKVLGEGGMGVVYVARQSSINRQVAIKMLKAKATDQRAKDKFLAEAVVTGDLDHPNIVPIYDLGSNKAGALFYSMKRVQGTPWDESIHSKSQYENIEILMKVCDAIAFAHSRGVVHRDIKPENVMIGAFGEVLVLDWGIAISSPLLDEMGADPSKTSMGGTPAYMAPEMATGPPERIGPSSDIYLLGAVLYEILTKRTPHTGRNVMACLQAAAKNEIRTPAVSGELIDIALRAMSTKVSDRFATVQDFQAAIREYQSHSESVALCQLADEGVATAKETRDYQDFGRAVFGYEQALALWAENHAATTGVTHAQLAWAECAYDKGDYELGISLLEKGQEEHGPLLEKLQAAQSERDSRQQRLANLKRIAGVLVACMLIGATSASIVIAMAWRQTDQERVKAETARRDAEASERRAINAKDEEAKARQLAEEAQKEEAIQRGIADNATIRAEQERDAAIRAEKSEAIQRQAAVQAKNEADSARFATEVAKQREEESAYKAEIQLAAERIRDNAMLNAQQLLDAQVSVGGVPSSKNKYRHWEWGRLRYLCDLAAHTFSAAGKSADGNVEAVAISNDQSHVAISHSDGSVAIWQRGDEADWTTSKEVGTMQEMWPVRSVAFSLDGNLFAIGGGQAGRGLVALWSLPSEMQKKVVEVRRWEDHEGEVTSVSFNDDGTQLLTSSADATARVYDVAATKSPLVFRGHFGRVWQARFSTDQRLIVTASEDGTARVWSVATGTEVQRFEQHDGPVLTAAFSPDGARVASAGVDRRLLLWDVDTVAKKKMDLPEGKARDEFLASRVDLIRKRLQGERVTPPQTVEFIGHRGRVRDVSFSPDGSLLLSGSDDHTLRVWDATWPSDNDDQRPSRLAHRLRARAKQADLETGLLQTLRGHGSWVTSCAWSTDGKAILSGSYDQTARLWDLRNYEEIQSMPGPARPILSASLSPLGTYVAAAYDDGTARIWRSDGTQVAEMTTLQEGHDFMASQAAFLANGSRLVTVAGDSTARIWDVQRGTEIQQLGGTGERSVVATSPDGIRFVTGSSSKYLVLWKWTDDRATEIGKLDHASTVMARLRKSLPEAKDELLNDRVPAIATAEFSPDGETIFAGDTDGGCWLWDVSKVDSGESVVPRTLPGHESAVNAAAFVGKQLVTASADYTVAFWSWKELRAARVSRLKHESAVTHLAIGPDQKHVATATVVRTKNAADRSKRESIVRLFYWRIGDEQPLSQLQVRLPDGQSVERVKSITFAPDGKSVLVVGAVGIQNHLLSWTLRSNVVEPAWAEPIAGVVSSASFVPGTQQIITVGGRGARLWTPDGRRLRTYRPHTAVTSIGFSPDERFVVTASNDGSAKVWTFDSGTPLAICKLEQNQDPTLKFGGHRGPINHVSFHPALGDLILTAGTDGTAKLWKFDRMTKTTEVVASFEQSGQTAAINAALFSPNGDYILAVSDDSMVRMWQTSESQKVVATIPHPAPVLCAAFSSDGRWIATGSADSQARVWDAKTGEPLVQYNGHSAAITSIAFSSDRQRLLTSSRDQLAKLWDTKIVWETQLERSRSDRPKSASFAQVRQDLLNFDAHQGAVTSAQFSVDGRTVMTSGVDGSVRLWHSERVGPALLLSLGTTEASEPSEWKLVDPNALVRAPNTIEFSGSRFVCELAAASGSLAGKESLKIGVEGSSVKVEESEVLLSTPTGESVIGKVDASSTSTKIVVNLNSAATSLTVEALIRSVAYQVRIAPEATVHRTITVSIGAPSKKATVTRATKRIVVRARANSTLQ